jgi:hypothetical protein
MINKYAAPVPTDYLHALPPDLRQHAASDRAPAYNPISNNDTNDKPTLSLLQVASSMTTTQAFGRPFEGFSEEQVRRAFHLGDTEGAPPGSPARATVQVPKPTYRKFFSRELLDAQAAAAEQAKIAEEGAAATKKRAAAAAAAAAAQAQEAAAATAQAAAAAAAAAAPSVTPALKKLKLKASVLKQSSSSSSLPTLAPPVVAPTPVLATVPAPAPAAAAAPPPPVRVPSPLVLPPAPVVDVSKLTGQRRVSDLTQPEVLTVRSFCFSWRGVKENGFCDFVSSFVSLILGRTCTRFSHVYISSSSSPSFLPSLPFSHPSLSQIAEEITKKLRAKRGKGMWRKQNPLDADITKENCAAMGIPQYFNVIQTPMNLQLMNVRERMEGGREGGKERRERRELDSISRTFLIPPSLSPPFHQTQQTAQGP